MMKSASEGIVYSSEDAGEHHGPEPPALPGDLGQRNGDEHPEHHRQDGQDEVLAGEAEDLRAVGQEPLHQSAPVPDVAVRLDDGEDFGGDDDAGHPAVVVHGDAKARR